MLRQEEDGHGCRPLQGAWGIPPTGRDDCWIQVGMLTLRVLQAGKGLVKVNGKPLSLIQPEILRFKVCGTR